MPPMTVRSKRRVPARFLLVALVVCGGLAVAGASAALASTFSVSGPATVSEAAGAATYDVTCTGTCLAESVTFSTQDVDATANQDYIGAPVVVPFAGPATVPVPVAIVPDAVDENNESFIAKLSSGPQTTTTILDDDSTPSISLVNDAAANEGSIDVFNINLSALSALPVSVNFSTIAGSAIPGSDFSYPLSS